MRLLMWNVNMNKIMLLWAAVRRHGTPLVFPKESCHTPLGNPSQPIPGGPMKKTTDVHRGTLGLMVLKTLDVLGPLHGYGLARRIEQISGNTLTLNPGTLYPLLLRLE